jgi:hypothetical protein
MPETDSVAAFCRDLKSLRVESGKLTLDVLAKGCHLGRSQISQTLNGEVKRVPGIDFVLSFVALCADHADKRGLPVSVSTDPKYWRQRHGALEQAVGAKPTDRPTNWGELVREHRAWSRVASPDPMREQVVAIADCLHAVYQSATRQLAGDPWLDPTFVERMTAMTGDLVGLVLAEEEVSPTEAAVLALAPLYHQARWADGAAALVKSVRPTDLAATGCKEENRESYERFLAGQQQRRLVARPGTHPEIGWWLFHRWLDTKPGASSAGRRDLFGAVTLEARLRKFLAGVLESVTKLFRLSLGDLRSVKPADFDELRPRSSVQTYPLGAQWVRERRVGLLAVVAHVQAIEVITLSSTIVEHLGIADPVDLDELATTVRDAYWNGAAEIGVGLVAECRHEAVLSALEDHAGRADAVCGAVHVVSATDTTLECLKVLPQRVSSDQVEPERDDAGEYIFKIPVSRFRLDETRVRELLMGEQLYGDRSLAIRELYQNALDACRYRQARYDFRAATNQGRPDWIGSIRFEEGWEHGRRYLLCSDNGIGMGEAELREVFSRAGARFADRTEFIEERAQWQAVGVHLYENSRFGIGVMSYFMLADEIEVTTCRMRLDTGRPDATVMVAISGPGHLFHIKPTADRAAGPGTDVKLFLRPDVVVPPCAEVLERLLGIAEFETVATGADQPWPASAFNARLRRPWESDGVNAGGALVHTERQDLGQVVWCEEGGSLLADGIYVRPMDEDGLLVTADRELDIHGAVVNLTGKGMPRLTVDRKASLEEVSDQVEALLVHAAPALLASYVPFLTFEWLCGVAKTSPLIADIIAREAAAAGYVLESSRGPVDMAIVGCFPPDPLLLGGKGVNKNRLRQDLRSISHISDHILLWRLLALRGPLSMGGSWALVGEVLPALPSDAPILEIPDRKIAVRPGHVVSTAAQVGSAPSSVAERMVALGYDVGDLEWPDRHGVERYDLDVLRVSAGRGGFLERGATVAVGLLVAAHNSTGVDISTLVERLRWFKFSVPEFAVTASRLSGVDSALTSVRLDGVSPWLDVEEVVSRQHIFCAAACLSLSVEHVVKRLRELGFDAPDIAESWDWSTEVISNVVEVLTEELWQPHVGGVTLAEIVSLSLLWNIDPPEVAGRMSAMGFSVPDSGVIPVSLEKSDADLIVSDSHRLSVLVRFYNIPAFHLVEAAKKTGWSVVAVAERLTDLGFTVPDLEVLAMLADPIGRDTAEYWSDPFRDWSVNDPYVSMSHFVGFCRESGYSPTDVFCHVEALGYGALPVRFLPDQVSGVSRSILMGQEFDGVREMIVRAPVAFAMLVAVQYDCALPEAIEAIAAMGIEIVGELPEVIVPEAADMELLTTVDGDRSFLDPFAPVDLRHLIGAALRTGRTIVDIAERLARLGLEVPDLDVELPPVLARVPTK